MHQLQAIITAIRGREASVEELTGLMEVLVMFGQYYSPREQQELAQRKNALGGERMQQVQQQWVDIFAGMRKAMAHGLPPQAREVQVLVADFTGGDASMHQPLENMYQQENSVKMMRAFGVDMDEALWAFYQQAMACDTSATK